ncbi:MAG: response regulator [Magnetococcales bacterium]|nr:response regulator [Magnetococcales bacterium]MBF0150538.1 response regulator [Magnetococcales bacterium]MBF0175069.1 response regulator [Magnetococcales bacterium]MBF0346918.1 response regulator [Magnetococcales bacterium]MBF0632981.1 response regulator [Magnetococcales bacterium]
MKKSTILIVDDDPDIRLFLRSNLVREGYEVVEAERGDQALLRCDTMLPDLVLLDANLPGLDGFQTCTAMKGLDGGGDMPIIMITGMDDDRTVDRAFAAGAEEFVTKPVRWPVLRQRIRLILERRSSMLHLQDSEKRFRHVTDSTTEAIVSMDGKGLIQFWNKGAELLFGYTSHQIMGLSIVLLMPEELRAEFEQAFFNAVALGFPRERGETVECVGLRQNGETFPMEISLAAWQIPGKPFFSAVMRDLGERARILGGLEGTALFDSRIIERITSLLAEVSGTDPMRVSKMHIRSLMETVFLAGLNREEDQPVMPNVLFMDRGYPINLNRKKKIEYQTLELEKSQPFTIDALVKLARGFDPENTVLAVCPQKNEPRNLEIWGAVFQEDNGPRLHPMIHHAPPENFLSVFSNRAGSLVVSWGNRVLARFHAGHFSLPGSSSFETSLIGQALFKTVRNHAEFVQYGEIYWSRYRNFIQRLLVEIGRGGFGGIVIWVPDHNDHRPMLSLVTRYRLTNAIEASRLLGGYCASRREEQGKGKKKRKEMREMARRVLFHARRMAHLSRVDGALILSHRLRPLSFGTMLSAQRWRGRTQYCLDDHGADRVDVDLEKYGTRHASAVNLVGAYPGVVAFVISQDGPIAGMIATSSEERVLWIPDLMNRF